MSEASKIWKNKLDYLQKQEAIIADQAQKFALAEQIRETKGKIAELEAQESSHDVPPQAFRADVRARWTSH